MDMYVPPGFATVTPYFFVRNASAFVNFLVLGLGGAEVLRHLRPDGEIANAQVKLGTATIMASEASGQYPPMPAAYYLYVADADAAMSRAIEHGATLEMPVSDMPYGDRQGGIRDQWGNIWWVSQRLVEAPYR
jgi:PhnB protein